jgi:hypothetical protein
MIYKYQPNFLLVFAAAADRNGLKLASKSKRHGALRNLFSLANRLQRPSQLRRGIYLTSVVYNGDRVLVTTSDDCLPTVLVDAGEAPLTSGLSVYSKL